MIGFLAWSFGDDSYIVVSLSTAMVAMMRQPAVYCIKVYAPGSCLRGKEFMIRSAPIRNVHIIANMEDFRRYEL